MAVGDGEIRAGVQPWASLVHVYWMHRHDLSKWGRIIAANPSQGYIVIDEPTPDGWQERRVDLDGTLEAVLDGFQLEWTGADGQPPAG